MLCVDDLTLSYGARTLLDHVSLAVEPGRIYGLVAPNGHGKTTLLRAMAGLPGARVAGTISVDDLPLRSQAARRRRVFYAPGEGTLLYPGMTARNHLKLVRDLWHPDCTLADVARRAKIEDFLDKRVRALSQGMKQQLTLAIAYMTGARYLLLDEPMNALDPTNVAFHSEILRDLATRGTGIVMSSHILDNVDQVSDEILFVKDAGLLRYAPGGAPRTGASVSRRGRHFARPLSVSARFDASPSPGLPSIGETGERAIDIYQRLYPHR